MVKKINNLYYHRIIVIAIFWMVIFFMMRFFDCLTDENSRQIGKDERLNKSYQYLNQINKYSKCNGNRGKTPTNSLIQSSENKYQ